jgi:hypothetical protein
MTTYETFEEAKAAGLAAVCIKKTMNLARARDRAGVGQITRVIMIGCYRLRPWADWERIESDPFDESEMQSRRALFEHAVLFALNGFDERDSWLQPHE